MSGAAYKAYQSTRVDTSSPEQLVLLLYNEAYKTAKLGLMALEAQRPDEANTRLGKVQAIMAELIAALDFDQPIAQNLYQLYEYINYQLIQANVRKAKEPVEQVLPLLKDLRDTWAQAVRQAGDGSAVPRSGGISLAQ